MAYEANSEENEQFKIPRPSTFQPEGTSKRGNYRTNVNLQTYGSLASRFKHVPRESMDLEPASDKNLTEEFKDPLFETKITLQRKYSRLRLVVIGLIILQLIVLVGIGTYLGVIAVPRERSSEDVKQRVGNLGRQVKDIETQINSSNACEMGPCRYGVCRNDGYGYICVCNQGYTGQNCTDEIKVVKTEGGKIILRIEQNNEEVVKSGMDKTNRDQWEVNYKESNLFLNKEDIFTTVNYTDLKGLKKLTYYSITIYKINWEQVLLACDQINVQLARHETVKRIQWKAATDADNGYMVTVRRLTERRSGSFSIESGQFSLEGLDPCTDYEIDIWRPTKTMGNVLIQKTVSSTVCEEKHFLLGQSIAHSEWSSGSLPNLLQDCNQPDSFSFPIRNRACNNNRNVGQAISNEEYHSGNFSYHFKRGQKRESISGCPTSPMLLFKAGRSDGNHTADVDGFYARLYFKAANSSGDDSRMEISPADTLGDDRVSDMVNIQATKNGIKIWAYEAGDLNTNQTCIVNKNCNQIFHENVVAKNLGLSVWHRLEMTFRSYPGDYNDTWTYRVNGEHETNNSAYLQAYHFEVDNVYKYPNRMRIRPRHQYKNARFQGFYFDDITFEVFNWSNPSKILDHYYTSFEED